MTLATLPMYDYPAARAATDAWWQGIARHCRAQGCSEVPDALSRGADLFAEWRAPDLFLSQTCGYILTTHLSDAAQPIATPQYSAPGCSGPHYASVILASLRHEGASVADFRGATAVYSLDYSHAGYNAFRALVAPLAKSAPFFHGVFSSGSHVESIRAIATGRADIGTVDCVVHAFVQRHDPNALVGTRALGYTAAAPAPPYITRLGCNPREIERLRAALRAAAVDPALADTRRQLFIDGFSFADYSRITDVEKAAHRMGYPELR